MTRTPPLFLGILMLFWGLQTGLLWAGALFGLILEGRFVISTRFKMTPADFNKFVDISTILLAGAFVAALTNEAITALKTVVRWLPAILFPIICAQVYSVERNVDIRSFFLTARKRTRQLFYEPRRVNVTFIYAFFVFISAGSANAEGYGFFAGMAVLTTWALWTKKSVRIPAAAWIAAILIVSGSALYFQKGIQAAGARVYRWGMYRYMSRYHWVNPFKTLTAIGELGRLKMSDRIVMMVDADPADPAAPLLIQSATYDKFIISSWHAKKEFTDVSFIDDNTDWRVNSGPEDHRLGIYQRPIRGRAVLSLPQGTVRISQMEAKRLEKNLFQTVRADGIKGLITAKVAFTGRPDYDSPPGPLDLQIPKSDQPAMEKLDRELGLTGLEDQEALKRIKSHFRNGFGYSLELRGRGRNKTSIENFLFDIRAGHCEFYATATVLALRQAGIPARYATGYVVHEYSKLSRLFIVRNRDAHAWTKVWLNGRWETLDTTPPGFIEADSRLVQTLWLTDLADLLRFELQRLRYETGKEFLGKYGLWLILPLGLILFFRVRKQGSIKRLSARDRHTGKQNSRTVEDPLKELEAFMTRSGFARSPSETRPAWARRISPQLGSPDRSARLEELTARYGRYRFSKQIPDQADEAHLAEEADDWITEFKNKKNE